MNGEIKSPKFTERDTRIIVAQMYVAKGLTRDPAKAIKFITSNREYFPNINDELLQKIMEEHDITQEQIEKLPEIVLADLDK